MRFVRIAVSQAQGKVVGVVEQSHPFDRGGTAHLHGEVVDMVDLGAIEDPVDGWTDRSGSATSPSCHIHQRIEDRGITLEQARSGSIEAAHIQVRAIHPCPCTHAGIYAHVRARGIESIPRPIRAWFAATLPEDHALAELGLTRGVSLADLRAAELERQRLDPHSGSRLVRFYQKVDERRKAATQAAASSKKPGRAS